VRSRHDHKTSLRDYERRHRPATAMILKVHQSNFFMGGFVESPSTEEDFGVTRKKRIPFVEDLGSGAVIETEKELGLAHHEPTPAESAWPRCGPRLLQRR